MKIILCGNDKGKKPSCDQLCKRKKRKRTKSLPFCG